MNWHHTYWWTWPAGIALGLGINYVIFCLIPPRMPAAQWAKSYWQLPVHALRGLQRLGRKAVHPQDGEQP